jgi:hypothetical protein
MSDEELRKKIERQMQEDFRADARMAYEKYGLTDTLHRGVARGFALIAVVLVGFFIWSIVRHH